VSLAEKHHKSSDIIPIRFVSIVMFKTSAEGKDSKNNSLQFANYYVVVSVELYFMVVEKDVPLFDHALEGKRKCEKNRTIPRYG